MISAFFKLLTSASLIFLKTYNSIMALLDFFHLIFYFTFYFSSRFPRLSRVRDGTYILLYLYVHNTFFKCLTHHNNYHVLLDILCLFVLFVFYLLWFSQLYISPRITWKDEEISVHDLLYNFTQYKAGTILI